MDIWARERTIKYLHFACRTFFENVKKKSKIDLMFQKPKNKQYKGQKPLRNKMLDFFETKKNRSAIIFHMASMPSPHLSYEPHSSKNVF